MILSFYLYHPYSSHFIPESKRPHLSQWFVGRHLHHLDTAYNQHLTPLKNRCFMSHSKILRLPSLAVEEDPQSKQSQIQKPFYL
jgi:hypothetical protein